MSSNNCRPPDITPLLVRKANGSDIDEDESSIVMQWLDWFGHPNQSSPIDKLFPLECDQWDHEAKSRFRWLRGRHCDWCQNNEETLYWYYERYGTSWFLCLEHSYAGARLEQTWAHRKMKDYEEL